MLSSHGLLCLSFLCLSIQMASVGRGGPEAHGSLLHHKGAASCLFDILYIIFLLPLYTLPLLLAFGAKI